MSNEKILVLIINHGVNQINFCDNLIKELKNIKKYFFDIKVFSSSSYTFENCENVLVTKYGGYNFSLSAYDYLKKCDLSNYTHVLLTENDILFSEDNCDYFFRYEESFKNQNCTIGFMRYELIENEKFLVDCGYDDGKISFSTKKGIVEVIEDKFFRSENCHQGCWLLQTDKLKKIISEIMIGPTLEDKVSNYFYSESWPGTTNGIKKFIPFCDFDKLLIHHQPNKYVNIYGNLPSVSELINKKNEHFICN